MQVGHVVQLDRGKGGLQLFSAVESTGVKSLGCVHLSHGQVHQGPVQGGRGVRAGDLRTADGLGRRGPAAARDSVGVVGGQREHQGAPTRIVTC